MSSEIKILNFCKCGKPAHPLYGGCEDCFADAAGHVSNDYYKEKKRDIGEFDEVENPLELPISELDLKTRTKIRLIAVGITYISDLIQWGESDLLGIRRIGQMALDEIKNSLVPLGLKLNP